MKLILALLLLASPASAQVRLYAYDCGSATLADASAISDTGEFDGHTVELADPCFVIQHPKGTLLWDAGFAPDAGPPAVPGPPLADQHLNIDLIAFSHLHFDHVGNANQFPRATWILNRAEVAWATEDHVSMQPALFSAYQHAQVRWIEGDHDVFGDGSVRILHVPGHTPGSQVLLLKLATQTILLSGDLYLQRESRQHGFVPTVNADRAQTLASQARVERIVKRLHARVIIQHDKRDYAELPKPPSYLR